MKTLRVLIPEGWPDQPQASWALLDDNGRLESEGISDPRQWPPSDRTEAVLNGAQLSWLSVRMPRTSVREQNKSLPFAIEEHLLREPDSQHATPTLRGDDSWTVLVIARDRLRRLMAQFQTIRRPLDAAYAACQTLPWEPASWTIGVDGTTLLIRNGEHAALCDDVIAGDETPSMLAEALEQAQANGTLPQSLRVQLANRSDASWVKTLKLPVEITGEWHWFSVPAGAANLLHGEFASRHRSDAWIKQLKPAAVVLACVFLADLLLGGVELGLRRSELNGIKSEMTRLFKSQLPGASVLDPALQLKRELNTQRLQHGQFADDAPLVLLAALAAALGAEAANTVQSIHYENGTLNVALTASSLDVAGLIQRLGASGITATRREGDGLQLALRRSEA